MTDAQIKCPCGSNVKDKRIADEFEAIQNGDIEIHRPPLRQACSHNWGKWRDGANASFVRVCENCKEREITFSEPHYVKRL